MLVSFVFNGSQISEVSSKVTPIVPINPEIARSLGNRVRVRVCGLLQEGDRILMINHKGLYGHDFWSLPGGGLEFGHSASETLQREFFEECGIKVDVGGLAFTCGVIKPPLHAIELILRITSFQGDPRPGVDPEIGKNQIISDLQFLSWEQIRQIPENQLHPLFSKLNHPSEISSCSGFFEFT